MSFCSFSLLKISHFDSHFVQIVNNKEAVTSSLIFKFGPQTKGNYGKFSYNTLPRFSQCTSADTAKIKVPISLINEGVQKQDRL